MCVLQYTWINIICINNTFILPFKQFKILKYTSVFNYKFYTDDIAVTTTSPYLTQF